MKVILFLLFAQRLINAATDADFDKLKVGLTALYSNSRMIPLVVRLVFHDLLLQSKLSGSGCIVGAPFLNDPLNSGLREVVDQLNTVVRNQNISQGTFTGGDLIAFAGKIAVETAYPCIRIPFLYHRGGCSSTAPSRAAGSTPPSPFSNSMADYNDHVKYLGMTHTEFAILVIGGHGIKDAAAHASASGWSGTFATFSSGKDFIDQTFKNNWTATTTGTNGAYISADPANRLMRIPSDMAFFPDAIPVAGRLQAGRTPQSVPFKDPNAAPVQEELRAFTSQPRISFDKAFGDVFTKLIARAGGKTYYREVESLGFCPEFPGETPPPSTVAVTNQTSTPNTTNTTSNSAAKLSSILGIFSILVFF